MAGRQERKAAVNAARKHARLVMPTLLRLSILTRTRA
jgi:hypothetical protein